MDISSKLSDIAKLVPPSGIRKFFDVAATMEGVVSLGVGEPDFDTPWAIREAAIYALEQGNTFYTANAGLIELRKEISSYLKRRFNVEYKKEEIIVTVGGSQALDLAFRAVLNPGDEVIIPSPAYVAYKPCIVLAGGVAVETELLPENEFKLTKDQLLSVITPRTKAIMINFPSNPTGGVMTKEDFEPLIDILVENEIVIITDEIYAELTYGKEHYSLACDLRVKNQLIYINGFSKAYSMTGWRLGYICAPKPIYDAMLRIHQYVPMCPPTISQYGAIVACRDCDKEVLKMKESFEQRRNFIVKGFNEIGLSTHLPDGAFYVFVNISACKMSSEEFAERLLNEVKVAVVPGTAFGLGGEGFVRVSYAYSIEEIKEALVRIKYFLEKCSNVSR